MRLGKFTLTICQASMIGAVSALTEPTSGTNQYDEHPLDSAPSPLLRALPAFERQFRSHLRQADAYANAAQARLAQSDQVLAEMVCRSCCRSHSPSHSATFSSNLRGCISVSYASMVHAAEQLSFGCLCLFISIFVDSPVGCRLRIRKAYIVYPE